MGKTGEEPGNSVRHLGYNQFNGSDSIVITRDDIIQFFRVTVRITDTNQCDAECMRFLNTDFLFLRVNNKNTVRNSVIEANQGAEEYVEEAAAEAEETIETAEEA